MYTAIRIFKAEQVPVFEPGNLDYERSVATPNLLFRFSRPDCVVLPETAAHVQSVIKEARDRKLKVTVKCGGHSYAGHSTAFKDISLDLSRMNTAKLDMNFKTVTIDAGCQWGHVYKTLVNGRHNGFIINGGRCPTVGVSGFMLGGGLGPFTRSFGMGSDTLKEATVVTADGRVVTVNDKDDPSSDKGRLFWALRGAGGGNFGVLIKMKLKVQRLRSKDGDVVAGRYQWFPGPAAEDDFLPTMNEFYTTDWPDRMTIDSTWMCDLRQRSGDGVRFVVYFDGSKGEFDGLVEHHVRQPELAKQLKRRSLPEKSTRFLHETLVSQWSEEITRAFPENKTYSIYTSIVLGNDLNTIRTATTIVREEMKAFRRLYTGEQVEFLVTWIHSGGKAMRKKPQDTAYFWREAVYHTYVTLLWEDKWMERDMRGFLGTVKRRLRPLSLNGEAAFINFPDGALSAKDHERAYFGDNCEELRRVKEYWDRDNFFSWPQGIRLPRAAGADKESDLGTSEEDLTDTIAGEQWEFFETKDFMQDLKDLTDRGY